MTLYEWLSVAQALTLALLAIIAASLKWGAGGGVLLKRVDDLETRMARADTQVSKLACAVQEMPERLRAGPDGFLGRREADLLLSESREDRRRLWTAVDDLRGTAS